MNRNSVALIAGVALLLPGFAAHSLDLPGSFNLAHDFAAKARMSQEKFVLAQAAERQIAVSTKLTKEEVIEALKALADAAQKSWRDEGSILRALGVNVEGEKYETKAYILPDTDKEKNFLTIVNMPDGSRKISFTRYMRETKRGSVYLVSMIGTVDGAAIALRINGKVEPEKVLDLRKAEVEFQATVLVDWIMYYREYLKKPSIS